MIGKNFEIWYCNNFALYVIAFEFSNLTGM